MATLRSRHRPPPSFTSSPDVAHSIIASFLPVSRWDCRLRVSEVSCAIFESIVKGMLRAAGRRVVWIDTGR